ncbi:MAG: GNAT family N-acetyltransferase [FCB group bacterium]|jgi:hypothetical protein|nr:GNAT family N-acetyltransferase [FCB group bacterium]
MAITDAARESPVEFKELPDRADDEWDRLVCASSQGTVYHNACWLRAVSRLTGDTVVLWGARHEGRLVAGVPLRVRRKGPFSDARRGFATPYNGAVLQPGLERPLREGLPRALRELAQRFSHCAIAASPFAAPLEADTGWRARSRATYLLRGGTADAVWTGMTSQVRNHIRVAEKAGVTVAVEPGGADFYRIYREVFEGQGLFVPFSQEAFVAFLATVRTEGLGEVYAARTRDGALCAASLVLRDERRGYHSLSASHRELKKTGAASLLVWEIIRELYRTLDAFDFGGANVPQIARFKSGFRGQLLEYPEYIHSRSLWEKALIGCARRVRSLTGTGAYD